MERQTGRRFLEDCVGQKVKYADPFRKKIFEGTLEHDSDIGVYYIATGGRNKPIICLGNHPKNFIVCDGEVINTQGRYETLDSVIVINPLGVSHRDSVLVINPLGVSHIAYIDEVDSRFKMRRRLTVETETGKILEEYSRPTY